VGVDDVVGVEVELVLPLESAPALVLGVASADLVSDFDAAGPLAELVEARESVMYQPLPLKTMPTGWMTLRSVPPHCSHVVSGESEKL
jgi:hypothetical protein